MKNTCIVLEGGGLRGVFTSGVLEYLLENEYSFGRVVGASAGACTGASFVSGQKGRNRIVNVEYPSDKRYMGLKYLLTKGYYFNYDFVFKEIPDHLVPYDEETALKNKTHFDVVTTSLETGKSVIFTKDDMKKTSICKALVASSSIPLLSTPAEINGKKYFDGGVADSIPVRYALTKHNKAVVVLTRPRGYRKGKMGFKGLIKFVFRKYPAFADTMLNRNNYYNETLEFCLEMERQGKLFIIAPEDKYMIGRTERNEKKRIRLYDHGYDCMKDNFKKMKSFLEKE